MITPGMIMMALACAAAAVMVIAMIFGKGE